MNKLAIFACAIVMTIVGCTGGINPSSGTNPVKPLEEKTVKFANGAQIDLKIVRPEGEGPYPVIILLHGYPETVDDKYFQAMKYFAARKFLVVAPNFPGFASKSGRASRINDLVEELCQWSEVKSDKIGAWGFSAGASVALLTAGKNEKVRAVAACSAEYDGLDRNLIEALDVPVLIQHGTGDGLEAAKQYEKQRREKNKLVQAVYTNKGHSWDMDPDIIKAATFFEDALR